MEQIWRSLVYTENKRKTRKALKKELVAATFYRAKGLYKGQPEKALVIEILGPDAPKQAARAARIAKKVGKQESVLVTNERVTGAWRWF